MSIFFAPFFSSAFFFLTFCQDGSFTIHGMADLEDVCTSLAFREVIVLSLLLNLYKVLILTIPFAIINPQIDVTNTSLSWLRYVRTGPVQKEGSC